MKHDSNYVVMSTPNSPCILYSTTVFGLLALYPFS